MSSETKSNGWISWGKDKLSRQLGFARSTVYNSTLGYFYTKDVMRNVLVDLPDNSRILDVGIGTGYVYAQNSDLIKRKNIKVVGVDIDPNYVRSAKHAVIDAELEEHIRIINIDIREALDSDTDLLNHSFDFVCFSDSFAVIPNVYTIITHCEKYLNSTGYMIITSTLFDKYSTNVDWIKQKLVYVSSVDFGNMMLKDDLEKYLRTRCTNTTDCFRLIDSKNLLGENYKINTYIVKWRPNVRDNS